VNGSDRAADRWREDYTIADVEGLDLHHLYRAMAWLGEELPAKEQDGRTPFAPRCLKDVVEERLFAHPHDLFTRLDLVFMDTTSLYLEGAGGQTLDRNGYSKDHRPDLRQMILAVLINGDGRPVCSEMWPGNTADVTTLIPVIDRLRRRFDIARVCVVADRGMISAATMAELEARRLLYILGVREPRTPSCRSPRTSTTSSSRARPSTTHSCATSPAADSSPSGATRCWSAGPAPARPIWPLPSAEAASAPAPVADSITWSGACRRDP
jgi:hypothetical protein